MFTEYLFLNLLLFFILFIKILMVILKFFKKFLVKKNILNEDVIDSLLDFSHTSFQISISLLLIILFNPFTDKYLILNHFVKIFLFMYGVLGIVYYSGN